MEMDLLGGSNLLLCPRPGGNQSLVEPSTTPDRTPIPWMPSTAAVLFLTEAVLTLLFAIVIALRYHSIRLFGRRLRSDYISNHMWIYFFLAIAASSMMDGTRYLLTVPQTEQHVGEHDDQQSLYLHTEQHSKQWERLQVVDSGLLLANTVLRALSFLALSLALRWEKAHRTGVVPIWSRRDRLRNPRFRYYTNGQDQDGEDDDNDNPDVDEGGPNEAGFSSADTLLHPGTQNELSFPSTRRYRARRRVPLHLRYRFWERLAIACFFLVLLALYVNVTPLPTHYIFFYMFVASYALQSLPVLALSLAILFSPTAPSTHSTSRILRQHHERAQKGEGPTLVTKLYLLVALLFFLPASILPPSVSFRLLQMTFTPDALPDFNPSPTSDPLHTQPITTIPLLDQCLGSVFWETMSMMDLLLALRLLSMLFWFLFVRQEFVRVKERCIWETVSRVQNTFGFLQNSTTRDDHADVPQEEEHGQSGGVEEETGLLMPGRFGTMRYK